jgi:hypothetical protein
MASAMIATAIVIDQRRTAQLPITYYQNKYKMGHCVIALNEYIQNNYPNTYTNFVYRMCATTVKNQYEGSLRVVYFKELFGQTHLNNHVILTNDKQLVIDPLFGLENMEINAYVRYIVENDLLDIKPEYKEIIFDIQPLLEEHRKNDRSQFVAQDPILCTFSVDIETKVVSM